MATPRLPFLYPNSLLRTIRACEPSTRHPLLPRQQQRSSTPRSKCAAGGTTSRVGYHSTARCRQTHTQRYGPAVEPRTPAPNSSQSPPGVPDAKTPILGQDAGAAAAQEEGPSESTASPSEQYAGEVAKDVEASETEKRIPSPFEIIPPDGEGRRGSRLEAHMEDGQEEHTGQEETPHSQSTELQSSNPTREEPEQPSQQEQHNPQTPLDKVLAMPSPSSNGHKPPHINTPPYVHHFDTYTLVQDLTKGGFEQDHSITIMKAVRGLLDVNIHLAKDGLISKSDVENERYLFNAACSELRTSIETSRLSESERQRSQRNQLQHEVDLLSQRMNQELLSLKDDLKSMFNDRKMATREEQRTLEKKIQELNYQITVALNSDSKSEVEGLRWILTRRAASALAICAVMIILALNYSSHRAHLEKERLAAKKKAEEEAERSSSSGSGNGSGGGTRTIVLKDEGVQADFDIMGHSHPGEAYGEIAG